ncbi:hypothetical protein HZU38_05355 [Mycolicibacterium vanbaalenii]|uniref:hypothetical protein n=1 Tax=Mycolicibacterium vanbaalenii TaxID=110539 RepID=UPI001F458FE5|nr:hypothetical protein [Mycolicibacterium vanbaalenii]UJL29928.1 hypothetical protein HZU38_05355 [Mycolicibacterium vanbaalenii]WND57010.1 hypothetical protein QQA43_00910 [Mycolicibacterium vanbaalenii]
MAMYTVIKPIAVTVGEGKNAAVKHFSRPGAEVELDDKTAAPLVEAGRVKAVPAAAERPKARPRTEGDAEG